MAIIDYVLLILLITCLYTDLTRRKIYNLALLPVLVIALVYHSASGGLPQGWWSLKGLALGTALLIVPFSMGGIGAGDVKFTGCGRRLQRAGIRFYGVSSRRYSRRDTFSRTTYPA